MKVSELSGALLDYWVARAEGIDKRGTHKTGASGLRFFDVETMHAFQPSQDWAQGGPIIERERIDVSLTWDYGASETPWYEASISSHEWPRYEGKMSDPRFGTYEGDTFLIAAMRCYVASRYGDSVPDEGEGK